MKFDVADLSLPAEGQPRCDLPHPIYGATCVFQPGHGAAQLEHGSGGVTHLALWGREPVRRLVWTTRP